MYPRLRIVEIFMRRALNRSWFVFGALVVVVLLPISLAMKHLAQQSLSSQPTLFVPPMTAEELQLESQEEEELKRISAGGEHHQPLKWLMNFPIAKPPTFKKAANAEIADDQPIIGIIDSSLAYAFPLDMLSNPRRHVVNFAGSDSAMSVSYCDISGCVRVFQDKDSTEIPLRVGGLDLDDKMVLVYGDQWYTQDSEALPLDEIPHEQTTWGKWIEKHPQSLVCVDDEEK